MFFSTLVMHIHCGREFIRIFPLVLYITWVGLPNSHKFMSPHLFTPLWLASSLVLPVFATIPPHATQTCDKQFLFGTGPALLSVPMFGMYLGDLGMHVSSGMVAGIRHAHGICDHPPRLTEDLSKIDSINRKSIEQLSNFY